MRKLRPSDDWYESEPPTRIGLAAELRRIGRRARVHPIRIVLVAGALTAAIVYRVASHVPNAEAQVVLALTEGSLSAEHNGIPVQELKQYVDGVLLPDRRLRELIERRDLYRLRAKAGIEYAIAKLRSGLTIEVWRNSFLADEDVPIAEHSARIGLTVSDRDPDVAYNIAHDLGNIVIQTAREHTQAVEQEVAAEVTSSTDGLNARLEQITRERSEREVALAAAVDRSDSDGAAALRLRLAELVPERKRIQEQLDQLTQSRDAIADRIAAAGLDMSIAIVEENHPERVEQHAFVLTMIAIVVGSGALLGAALVLGAFDSRIHDIGDVARLGLPVLGHVPAFPGDHIGSLRARGVPTGR